MSISNLKVEKEIIIFTVVVITLSSAICFISYKLENLNLSILSIFTPSIVALVLTAITKGKKGLHKLFVQQTLKKTGFKWLVISLITIPTLSALAVLTSLNFDFSSFNLRTTELLPQMVIIALIAVGEEYGWRGFLLPRLMNKFNLFYSSIILGLIWGLWHFPAYLIGTGVPLKMDFIVFLLWVITGTLFISWIYYYTQSVLTSILVHLSANAAFNYLPILPEFSGNMNAFWIFIAFLLILIITVFFIKRKDLLNLKL